MENNGEQFLKAYFVCVWLFENLEDLRLGFKNGHYIVELEGG